MKLLVVGAGSTGGYFGGRLAQAGRDVTFLVRPGRAAQLKSQGLRIVSPHGDITLTPKVATTETVEGPFDAVLLTVKGFSLEAGTVNLVGGRHASLKYGDGKHSTLQQLPLPPRDHQPRGLALLPLFTELS